MALEPGDLIPQFAVTTRDGSAFDYSGIWQRRNLLLIALPATTSRVEVDRYVSEITGRPDELADFDATCVVTNDPVPRVRPPAVIVADKWGEIYLAATGSSVSDLPPATEIFELLRYLAHECPECTG